MAYLLDSQTIRNPSSINETNSTQTALQRPLSGDYTRDIFGLNKRIWTLTYENVNINDYNTIYAIYASYLSTNTAKTWSTTETNYTISQVNVHVDLLTRDFTVKGNSYLSNFTLILTET